VAGLCFLGARREDREAAGSWPPFWLLTGALLVVMAIGRAGDIADVLTDALRERAVAGGWYESRRRVQGAVVAAVGLIWFVAVMAACWRVPARRRRYLPMIVIVLTLGAYAAIRVVSLHQIDAILHRRQFAGMRYGTAMEYALLVVAGACALWTPRRQDPDVTRNSDIAATPSQVSGSSGRAQPAARQDPP
jgi:hypothetical protein